MGEKKVEKSEPERSSRKRAAISGIICVAVALLIYFLPVPEGVDSRGMHMLGIFVGTILALILQPLPTAAVAIIGLTASMLTGSMSASKEAFVGLGSSSVWLIVAAFFIAQGFVSTGLVALLLMPRVVYAVFPPTLKQTPAAKEDARTKRREMGSMSVQEKIMATTFILMLVLWCLSSVLNILATAVAFLGVSVLLVSGILKWKDMAANKSAWQTLIFFGILVGMASQLNTLGVIDWIGSMLFGSVSGFSWPVVLVILLILYFCCTTRLPQSSPK